MPLSAVQDTEPSANDPPGTVYLTLEHPLFSRVAGVSFRRSASDGEPVMVVPFEEREATLPLPGIKREFEITDDSADGRMLALVAESLSYVTALFPGDPLPAEIVNGEASWTPSISFLRRAKIRLRVQLIGWLDPAAARLAVRDLEGGDRMETDPELKTALYNASRKAAEALGAADPLEVMARIDALANEFAYTEALRNELLVPVQALLARTARMAAQLNRSDGVRADSLNRVQKMTTTTLNELAGRFEKIDEVCRDIIALLREPEVRVAFIRENRDMLYRNRLGWDPILEQWNDLDEDDDTALWLAVANTYQFLARRYLTVTEWPSFAALRSSLAAGKKLNGMRW